MAIKRGRSTPGAGTKAGVRLTTSKDEYLYSELTDRVIGAAIEVHRGLGPGLLESAYQACLAKEFELRGIPFEREVSVPVQYKGMPVDCSYRLDFLVDKKVIVELKAVDVLLPIHEAQLISYLRLTSYPVGLLLNFNVRLLKDGLLRRVL